MSYELFGLFVTEVLALAHFNMNFQQQYNLIIPQRQMLMLNRRKKSIATIPPSLSTLASNYNNVEDFIASLPIFDQGSIDILQNVTMGQSEQWFEQCKGELQDLWLTV